MATIAEIEELKRAKEIVDRALDQAIEFSGEPREQLDLTEDEEDLIVALRRESEPTVSFEDLLSRYGRALDK